MPLSRKRDNTHEEPRGKPDGINRKTIDYKANGITPRPLFHYETSGGTGAPWQSQNFGCFFLWKCSSENRRDRTANHVDAANCACIHNDSSCRRNV